MYKLRNKLRNKLLMTEKVEKDKKFYDYFLHYKRQPLRLLLLNGRGIKLN